jgi:DNA adenine methylase
MNKQVKDLKITVKTPFQYMGGKYFMAKRIIQRMPPHTVYVEPFFGSGAVFFSKPPSKIEVVSDINQDIINFFACLRDDRLYETLSHQLTNTPYARKEFENALSILKNPFIDGIPNINRAWAWYVFISGSFSGKANAEKIKSSDWHYSVKKNHAKVFSNKTNGLEYFKERLRNAYIECQDALKVIGRYDSKDTFFYLDPPYHSKTIRQKDTYYLKGLTDTYYSELLGKLTKLEGKAILSGYDSEEFNVLEENGWEKEIFPTVCHAAGKIKGSGLKGEGAVKEKQQRVEVLWIKKQ